MGRLAKFSRLARADQGLVLSALMAVLLVRAALWVLPFRWLRDWIVNRASASDQATPGMSNQPGLSNQHVQRIAWAVAAVSKVVPAATCLTQALATQWLLNRAGIGSTLRLGVGRNESGAFGAHAWVEQAGRVVIGGGNPAHYAPLPAL